MPKACPKLAQSMPRASSKQPKVGLEQAQSKLRTYPVQAQSITVLPQFALQNSGGTHTDIKLRFRGMGKKMHVLGPYFRYLKTIGFAGHQIGPPLSGSLYFLFGQTHYWIIPFTKVHQSSLCVLRLMPHRPSHPPSHPFMHQPTHSPTLPPVP